MPNIEDILIDLDIIALELDEEGKEVIAQTKREIHNMIETIDRLRKGESDLPTPNRASQESGS